jgi:hypothetical protein
VKRAKVIGDAGGCEEVDMGVIMTNKRDMTAEELSPWWTHGVVLMAVAVMTLIWWIAKA